jgi:hypothetical protein
MIIVGCAMLEGYTGSAFRHNLPFALNLGKIVVYFP